MGLSTKHRAFALCGFTNQVRRVADAIGMINRWDAVLNVHSRAKPSHNMGGKASKEASNAITHGYSLSITREGIVKKISR